MVNFRTSTSAQLSVAVDAGLRPRARRTPTATGAAAESTTGGCWPRRGALACRNSTVCSRRIETELKKRGRSPKRLNAWSRRARRDGGVRGALDHSPRGHADRRYKRSSPLGRHPGADLLGGSGRRTTKGLRRTGRIRASPATSHGVERSRIAARSLADVGISPGHKASRGRAADPGARTSATRPSVESQEGAGVVLAVSAVDLLVFGLAAPGGLLPVLIKPCERPRLRMPRVMSDGRRTRPAP